MASTVLPLQPSAEPLNHGDSLYEVVNGQRVELPMGAYETDLATEMATNVDNSPYWQDDHIHQTVTGSQRQAALMAAFLDAAGVIPKP